MVIKMLYNQCYDIIVLVVESRDVLAMLEWHTSVFIKKNYKRNITSKSFHNRISRNFKNVRMTYSSTFEKKSYTSNIA